MKNKKKFFNKNLYLEGIRQLKVVGILGIVINLIFAIVIPVGSYLSARAEYRSYVNNHMADQFTKYAIDVTEYHIYYLLFFLIFTPLMVITLFRFLNRRENCDFYHSLPHTRQCLLLSFFCAVLTWLAGQIFLITAVSAILYQIFSDYLILEFFRLFCFAVNILAASLLVGSTLLLACTLSGNTITSMIVFLILFFTPRIFITIYQFMMTNQLGYLASSITPVLNIRNNLFYNILQALNSDSSAYIDVTSISFQTAYTLFIAALLFVMAYIFFLKRKSEAAENSMNNKILQTIFRTIFTMLLCMIPINLLFSYYTERNIIFYQYRYDNTAMIVFYIVISYIAVILGMFLYELLTTKSAKSALRSLKSIPGIVVLNIAVFALLAASFGHYKNLRLDEEEIDSVNLLSMGYFYKDDYYNQSSYFEAMIAKYDFTEEELISLLCTAFNDYAEMYSDYLDGKREHVYSEIYSYNTCSLTVQFHGKSNYTFRLQLDAKTAEQFYQLLYFNKEFYKIYTTLPELTDKDTIYFFSANGSGLNEAFTKELYESLKSELADAEIDSKQWIESVNSYGIGYLIVDKYIDSVYYNLNVPINLNTPKTYQKLMDYYKRTHTEDLEAFLDSLQEFEETLFDFFQNGGDNTEYFDIIGYDSINASCSSIYFSSTDESQEEYESNVSYLKKVLTLLREYTKPISEMNLGKDLLIYVRKERLNFSAYDEDWEKSYILCIPIEIFSQIDGTTFEQ